MKVASLFLEVDIARWLSGRIQLEQELFHFANGHQSTWPYHWVKLLSGKFSTVHNAMILNWNGLNKKQTKEKQSNILLAWDELGWDAPSKSQLPAMIAKGPNLVHLDKDKARESALTCASGRAFQMLRRCKLCSAKHSDVAAMHIVWGRWGLVVVVVVWCNQL